MLVPIDGVTTVFAAYVGPSLQSGGGAVTARQPGRVAEPQPNYPVWPPFLPVRGLEQWLIVEMETCLSFLSSCGAQIIQLEDSKVCGGRGTKND